MSVAPEAERSASQRTSSQPSGSRNGRASSALILVDRREAQGWRVTQDARLDHLFEEQVDWIREYGRPGQLAVDSDEGSLTYEQLDTRANQLARYLRLYGAGPGDRIALLLDSPVQSYVAMLAVLKIGGTYVPLDIAYSTGRLAYIVEDAQATTVLSMTQVTRRVEQVELITDAGAMLIKLDEVAPLVAEIDGRRLLDAERGVLPHDSPAYISYASMSGRPEGVAIDHVSICNFVKVASEVYGIRASDRVYQGLPLALDFAVEEIWVPWLSGATLVPKPAGTGLVGTELHDFLRARRINALCCVPAMLDTMDADLPDLRFLLMRGKDADAELIERWARPERRFLSVYGPTEATVTATWAELRPGKPATIGMPLPTYSCVILDKENPHRALPHGEVGEIGIAGIGLTCGYLNHDDLTEDVFISDFLGIPANPSGRIYRTGDLGRVNDDREIEYLGPLDPDAEPRGYRIELTDVAPLLTTPRVDPPPILVPEPRWRGPEVPAEMADAVTELIPRIDFDLDSAAPPVDTAVEDGFAAILADVLGRSDGKAPAEGHFFDDLGADSLTMAQFCARVRKRSDLPTVSMKDVYRFPSIGALAGALSDTQSTPMERSLAEVLAGVLGNPVRVGSHFFDDLGADSLTMAQFCARVRKRVDLPTVSMKDIYAHTSVRALAAALDPGSGGPAAPSGELRGAEALHVGPSSGGRYPPDVWAPEEVRVAARSRYWLCGLLQLSTGLGGLLFGSVVAIRCIEWTAAAPTYLGKYERGAVLLVVAIVIACVLPVVAKWILIGKWTPQQFPVWSLAYLRFWLTKSLIRLNPLGVFVGSPLYSVYLRSLGAKVGKGTAVFSPQIAMCPDLFSVGDNAVIRKGVIAQCYRAHRGMIQIGPVTIGDRAVVGEKAVLDINTRIADDAQLGHGSSLHFGQVIPPGERWHGSPAEPTTTDYRRVPPMRITNLRRVLFSAYQLLPGLLIGPALMGAVLWIGARIPQIPALLNGPATAVMSRNPYELAAGVTVVMFFGGLVLSMIIAFTVPRLLNKLIEPDKVYPLYGFHHVVHSMISGMTNLAGLLQLFGDSVYVTDFLRGIGYRLTPLQQTGSNFGSQVQHDIPYLCQVGTGTVVADGLIMVNTEFTDSSFRVSRVTLGANSFLGNNVIYPAEGRTGDNCLLGTKVMIPIDGPVREGVGLLGSPPFEIPRTVERDKNLEMQSPEETSRRLARKTLHNTVTIFIRILSRLMLGFLMMALFAASAALYGTYRTLAFIPVALVAGPAVLAYMVLIDRAVRHLQVLVPNGCSILDKRFWRHERYWKVPFTFYEMAFNGTPLKGLLWRAMGVKVGKRLFDDGCALIEKRFASVGDDCTLNVGSIVQCHSQEDGAFKSDYSSLGNGVTLGVGAFVHYGVQIGDNAVLAPDSFLMKGEEVPPGTWWGGNPAEERGNAAIEAVENAAVRNRAPKAIEAPAHQSV